MELILLAVGAIVWMVLKALSQPPPKPPPPQQRTVQHHAPQAGGGRKPAVPPSHIETGTQYFAEQEEIAVEIEELDEEIGSVGISITNEALVQSVVMAEVLGPPRARKPHRMYR